MLIVIDVMGTGETEIDTTKDKKKDASKKRRPQMHELPQETLQIVEIERKRQ